MNEKNEFKSFGDMAEAFDNERKEAEKEEVKELLEKSFGERLLHTPGGHFSSHFEEIQSITFVPLKNTSENEHPQLHAVITYITPDNQTRNITWTIFDDGTVSGKVPPNLNIDREALKKELLGLLDTLTSEFIYGADVRILPDKDSKEGNAEGIDDDDDKPTVDAIVRTEQLEFMSKQEKAVFTFYDKKIGFDGYHATIFNGFIILEHPQYGNATYVIPLQKPLKIDQTELHGSDNTPLTNRLSSKMKDKIIDEYWEPIGKVATTRKALRNIFRAQRFFHSENWENTMQGIIEKFPTLNE
jgi:hypothetical protein